MIPGRGNATSGLLPLSVGPRADGADCAGADGEFDFVEGVRAVHGRLPVSKACDAMIAATASVNPKRRIRSVSRALAKGCCSPSSGPEPLCKFATAMRRANSKLLALTAAPVLNRFCIENIPYPAHAPRIVAGFFLSLWAA